MPKWTVWWVEKCGVPFLEHEMDTVMLFLPGWWTGAPTESVLVVATEGYNIIVVTRGWVSSPSVSLKGVLIAITILINNFSYLY